MLGLGLKLSFYSSQSSPKEKIKSNFLSKSIDYFYHAFDFFTTHHRRDRQTYNSAVDFLAYRIAVICPLFIRALLMRRRRVMNDSLHSIFAQIRLKFIASIRANHKAMPHTSIFIIRLWQDNFRIYDTLPDIDRGFHAHKDLEQVIVAMDGACEFILDDGVSREQVRLNRPDIGLYIGKNMWREMKHFSYGCKLMVLASEYYDEKEYIRDYQAFLESTKTQNGFKILTTNGKKSLKSG